MLILTAIPDSQLTVSSQQRVLNPNTLADCYTHTHTQAYAHMPGEKGWERDNWETTAVSYRKCITERA